MVLKEIKNDCLQGLELYFKTEKGINRIYLNPKESITVPDYYLTDIIFNLFRRRMIKIANA
jgi:hypothetical protein